MTKYRIKSFMDNEGDDMWKIQKKYCGLFWISISSGYSKGYAQGRLQRYQAAETNKKHFKSEVEYPQ